MDQFRDGMDQFRGEMRSFYRRTGPFYDGIESFRGEIGPFCGSIASVYDSIFDGMEVFYFFTEVLKITYYKNWLQTVGTTNCGGQRRASFGYKYRFGSSPRTSAYSST
jgi:hypothetical protein